MPNCVHTRCTITGPADDIEAFGSRMLTLKHNFEIETYKIETYMSLNFDQLKDSGQVAFFWLVVESVEPLEFLCETKWYFPEAFLKALASEFPTLHFKCVAVEDGAQFAVTGYFNPPEGEEAWAYCDFSEKLYERVWNEKYYGHLQNQDKIVESVTSQDDS